MTAVAALQTVPLELSVLPSKVFIKNAVAVIEAREAVYMSYI